MEVSPDVERMVDEALAGRKLEHDELVRLFDLDEHSLDAYYVNWAGNKRTRDLCDNTADVHAQIGIDADPCSKNCLFCSFAAINTARSGRMEMPIDQIITYAKAYVEGGANCLTIMITADYDFGQYVDYLAQVREVIGPDMPMTANMGDFDVDMAKRLKAAGVGSVYHAVRMGEGIVNEIPMDTRFETIAAAQEVGLKVLTCLEMIDPRYTNDEVADVMLRLAATKPAMANAWGMVAVPGTKLCDDPHYSHPKYNLYDSCMRLLCSDETRFGNGSLTWAEVGTNPRDSSNQTEVDGIGEGLADTFKKCRERGFKTYEGPSPWF